MPIIKGKADATKARKPTKGDSVLTVKVHIPDAAAGVLMRATGTATPNEAAQKVLLLFRKPAPLPTASTKKKAKA